MVVSSTSGVSGSTVGSSGSTVGSSTSGATSAGTIILNIVFATSSVESVIATLLLVVCATCEILNALSVYEPHQSSSITILSVVTLPGLVPV